MVVPTFERGTNDGSYRLVDDGHGRLPVVLIGGANAALLIHSQGAGVRAIVQFGE